MSFFNIFKSSKNAQIIDNCEVDDLDMETVPNAESNNLPVNIQDQDINILSQLRSAGDTANKIGEYWMENKRINANIKVLRIQTNASLQKHAKYMMTMQSIATMAFAERHTALNKHYEVLERAMKANDREMIISSLQGISSIVVKNPLEDLAKIAYTLKNPSETLELDF